MADFVHLHTHSEYSLLDGLGKLDTLIGTAKNLGMNSLALTDHGAMYGSFKFFLKAQEAGIKPIVGCELYMAEHSRFDKQERLGSDQYHLVLLAKNLTGYQNLMKLVSLAHLEGFHYKPRVDLELLKKYGEGLIALSGCMQGIIAKSIRNNEPAKTERWINNYCEAFGEENFYIELQRHPNMPELDEQNEELVKLSRKFGLPLVATADVHYPTKDDAYAQEILLCIQTRSSMMERDRPISMLDTPDYYLKSAAEMKELFADYPEAIENTVKIAQECSVEIPYGNWILPHFPVPRGETVETWLKKLTYQRFPERYGDSSSVLKKRIEYELDIITSKGYAAYFLIVQDFVNWAKGNGIVVGPGRGSAAGSIVAYILGITALDPILHNLPFERFLNPSRPTPPDIDIDFADVRRDDVLRYVMQKYGEDKVAQIITFGTMESRMVVRDVARALGWSYSQGDRIAKLIPPPRQGFSTSLESALKESTELLHLYKTDEKVHELIEVSKKLESMVRHSSVHAAGVVVADKPLMEYVPIQREAKGGKVVTQYDMYCLDLNAVSDARAVGLLKFDFLGLRNLSILETALSYVNKNKGAQEQLKLDRIAFDDQKTYALIARGETVGVFQLESRGMQALGKDLQPTQFSDIAAMVALYRPGPMALIPQFIEGKKNPKKIKYLHPDLKEVLSETYGILVYQEQVTEIAHRLAGFTMAEGDVLRMAMGKKKKSLMKKGKAQFLKGCVKNGYTGRMAEQLFAFIEKFAAYGFNKAHSASYATISYWTAYVKAHYPVEFMTALISAEVSHATGAARDQKVSQVLEECRRMDIEVLPPDINKSAYDFAIEAAAIRFGLSGIKNVGSAAVEDIILARQGGRFQSFKDFLMRVDLRKNNKRTIEGLIKSGGFDEYGARRQLMEYYPTLVKDVQREKTQQEAGQFDLFSTAAAKSTVFVDQLPAVGEFDEDTLLSYEREAIGFNLGTNPLDKYEHIFRQKGVVSLEHISAVTGIILVGGLVKAVKKITTKKDGKEMAFATLTDYTGDIELVVFPSIYAQTKQLWKEHTIIMAKGRLQERDGVKTLLVEKAVSMDIYEHQ